MSNSKMEMSTSQSQFNGDYFLSQSQLTAGSSVPDGFIVSEDEARYMLPTISSAAMPTRQEELEQVTASYR